MRRILAAIQSEFWQSPLGELIRPPVCDCPVCSHADAV